MMGINDIVYEKSLNYWSKIPATVDGVLGGFGFISDADIEGSNSFLQSIILGYNLDTHIALDCGAGIGRIAKHLLIPTFEKVDVVEPDPKFINAIKDYVGKDSHKIDALYQGSLQDFTPTKKYDVIWNQWVLGYLTDTDLVLYLERCSNALAPNGVIVVKENVTSSGKAESDEADSSITRSYKQLLKIFKSANLKRIKQCKQTNFPSGIYPVYMFALRPKLVGALESDTNNDLSEDSKNCVTDMT